MTFSRFKGALMPRRVGFWDPAWFLSEESFRAFVVTQSENVRRCFLEMGGGPTVFYVYCTRNPSTKHPASVVYRVGPPPPELECSPQSKQLLADLVSGTAAFGAAVCTVMISEVWMVMAQDQAEWRSLCGGDASIEGHSRRVEAVFLSVEHQMWPTATGFAEITRPVTGAQLGPWQISHEVRNRGGRFTDLTPHAKGSADA